MANTIADKLQYLSDIKSRLQSTFERKGIGVGDRFSDYPDQLEKLRVVEEQPFVVPSLGIQLTGYATGGGSVPADTVTASCDGAYLVLKIANASVGYGTQYGGGSIILSGDIRIPIR